MPRGLSQSARKGRSVAPSEEDSESESGVAMHDPVNMNSRSIPLQKPIENVITPTGQARDLGDNQAKTTKSEPELSNPRDSKDSSACHISAVAALPEPPTHHDDIAGGDDCNDD